MLLHEAIVEINYEWSTEVTDFVLPQQLAEWTNNIMKISSSLTRISGVCCFATPQQTLSTDILLGETNMTQNITLQNSCSPE